MRATLSHSIGMLLAAAVVVAGAAPVQAVTINYVGTEPGGAASGYATANWSNANVAKQFATGSSNRYGKDGYWQIRPSDGSQFYEVVGGSNDLGTSASSFPTLTSGTPAFVGSLQGFAGSFVNFSSAGYALYRGPDGSALYYQGALSVPVGQGPYNTPSGTSNGYFGDTLTFSLTYSGTVRVGFAVDSVGSATYAPDYVTVYTGGIGSTFSSQLTRDGTPDMAVFDIVNPSGETFSVAQWQLGTPSVSAMSLVTFDLIAVPEPSSIALLATGAAAFAGRRFRRRS